MSHAAFDSLAGLLEGPANARRGNNRDIVGRVKRIINRAPEVMVKVSGNAKGAKHLKSHMDYISRNGMLELETERGDIIKGKEDVKQLHKDWIQDQSKRRANTRDSTNIVLSMPKGTSPKVLKNSARAFAAKQFGDNHQYVFVLHTDVDHPHVHLTVKNLGYDNRRLQVKNGDIQKWRQVFAKELRQRGLEAEATSRGARGIVKKALSQVVKHIRDRGVVAKVDKARIKEIAEEIKDLSANKPPKPKPWEKIIKNRQQHVRKTWLSAAKQLNGSSDPIETSLARQIVRFVGDMPTLDTLRHEISSDIVIMLKKQQMDNISLDLGRRSKTSQRDDDNER